MKESRKKMLRRFWSGIDAGPPDQCWPWKGPVNNSGYGRFRGEDGEVRTHRLSYSLTRGPIPAGMFVRHLCHNRRCCNPMHLEIGTHRDNMRDMVEAGRSLQGERCPASRLTAEKARAACILYYGAGLTLREVGDSLGVHLSTVGYIVQGKTWTEETADLREHYAKQSHPVTRAVLGRKKRSRAKKAKLGVAS